MNRTSTTFILGLFAILMLAACSTTQDPPKHYDDINWHGFPYNIQAG
jgi:outer membrane biogenesis lipoprotein LolB